MSGKILGLAKVFQLNTITIIRQLDNYISY